MTHWPGGLALAFPAGKTVNGTLVLAAGDVNLTFKRYIERPVTLRIEDDYITRIEGDGVDAELMRSYIAAWGDRDAYAVSHVGYGLNTAARWDSMTLYDKRDFNGTELRAFSGNFLYSTGANEVAGRHTRGHFDLPMRHCTVELDGAVVVDAGKVVA
jgi:2,5-dihydroxypyridine 5,6-dioxygenase